MQKGFTIIELIVVITIIAVLAAIVIVGVINYVNKAKDAAVKSSLSQVAKNLQIYYSSHSNYDSLTQNPVISLPCNDSQNSYNINKTEKEYAVYAKLCSNGHYLCLDSTGKSVEQTDAPTDTTCSGILCSPDCTGCQSCSLESGTCFNDDNKCNPGEYCNNGNCELVCDPVANCQGKVCGDDGCGGRCGECTGDCGSCNESNGQCEATQCSDCRSCDMQGNVGTCTGGCPGGASCSQCNSMTNQCEDNGSCGSNCKSCNTATGECYGGGCQGCQTCDGMGHCNDNNMNCDSASCQYCSNSVCVSSCTGCQSCNGGYCYDDSGKCSGCQSCNAGTCSDDNSKCNYYNCESCSNGICAGCTGCQTCNGSGPGGCYDNSMNCNWANCEDCSGGTCQNRCYNWGQNCDGMGGCY